MQTLHQLQDAFESYLSRQRFPDNPSNLYEPIRYVLGMGGKRFRPVLLLMACEAFDTPYERALPAALAIEIFHNFTLVHDDIMDNAPLRRGKPTVHEQFGLNPAILSGDVMLVYAYHYLLQCQGIDGFEEAIQQFTRTAIDICEGQQMDMDFEQRQDVSVEEYLKMIELKTAVLVGASLKMGALLGGAQADQAENLYEFGRNLGIAFQLQDDLLDAFGDPALFGKKTGGDILQNKKTFLYLKALSLAAPGARNELLNWYSNTSFDENEKVTAVKRLFENLQIPAQTEALKNTYFEKAMAHLSRINSANPMIGELHQFALMLMLRNK